MTDVPATFTQAECNGDKPPENGQQPITKISEELTDVDSPLPHYRVEPSLEGALTKGSQEERRKLQGNMLLNSSMKDKMLKGKVFPFSLIFLFWLINLPWIFLINYYQNELDTPKM